MASTHLYCLTQLLQNKARLSAGQGDALYAHRSRWQALSREIAENFRKEAGNRTKNAKNLLINM